MVSLLVSLLAVQAMPPGVAQSRVESVTVYRRHALVVRRARVRIPALARDGSVRIRVGGLPNVFETGSLQARCDGPARPSIASLAVSTVAMPRPQAAPPSAKPRPTKAEGLELVRLRRRMRSLGRLLPLLQERATTLRKLRQLHLGRIAKGSKDLDLEQAVQEQVHLDEALEVISKRRGKVEEERTTIRSRIGVLAARMKPAPTPVRAAPVLRNVADLELLARRPGKVVCELRYLVRGASWSSAYDARLEGATLRLTHYAWVNNRSGEHWPQVKVALSTADFTGNAHVPNYEGRVLRLAPRHRRARGLLGRPWKASAKAATPASESADARRAPTPPSVPQARRVQRAMFAVYGAGRRASIPFGPKPRRIYLTTTTFRPSLRYLALPRASDTAYLTARVTVEKQLPILGGPTRLFLGDDYVGRTKLKTTYAGQKLSFSFGRDERVRVTRAHRRRDLGLVPDRELRRLSDWFEIRVRNRTGRRIQVDVVDALPVSPDQGVKIALDTESTSPLAKRKMDPPGTLRWTVRLAHRGQRRIHFGYQVEYPAGRRLIGL